MRTEVHRWWAGTEERLPRAVFSRKCLPSSRVRADAASLPHLSSPLPVPLRVLVPGWCFLVAAAAVSMCVTDPMCSATGGPLPALRLARRAVALACAPSSASAPGFLITCGRAQLLAPKPCAVPGDSADGLGCPRLPAPPPPEAVVQGVGVDGVRRGGFSACFT